MSEIRAVLYARVSTEEQAREGYSIAAQNAELKRHAEQQGYRLVETYVDEGVSGKSIEGRPRMKQLLKDARDHKFDVVMVYKIDRLARKLSDSLDISETLEKNNVKLVSLKENFDTRTPSGRTLFQMMCSFAELERNTILDRVKMGMEQRAKQGKYNGGIVLGYDAVNKELVINEEETHIVRSIFNMAEQDMGLKAITRRLNEMGYRSKKNNQFSTLTVKTILNNPMYIGKIRFNQVENWAEKRRSGKNTEYILADGVHEPIISIEQWDTVQRLMSKRSYKPSRSNKPTLLGGLLRCPKCGYGMVIGRPKGSKSGADYRIYKCGQYHNKGKTACQSHSIKAEATEQYVFNELSRIASSDYILHKLVDKINKDRLHAEQPLLEEKKLVENKIGKTQSKLNNLKEKIMTDADMLEMFRPNLISLQDELKMLQQQKERLVVQLDTQETEPIDFHALKKLLADFNTVLKSAEPDEQKSLLRMIIKDIQITKDAPRKSGRYITKINLLFDFTIESLQANSFSFIRKVYSGYDFVADFDTRSLDGVTLANFHKSGVGEVMASLSILPLLMIRFPPINLHRPVNLLRQHEAHQLVRQRHAAEAQLLLSPAQHRQR